RYNSDADFPKLIQAWEFAKKAHGKQKRKSGEDFVIHPLQVAIYLSEWKLDTTSIVSGLLHDVIEDTDFSYRDIEKKFGNDVAFIVNGVTKITSIEFNGTKTELYAENRRTMLLVIANDLRVVFVRLADRMHNMQT